MIGCEPGREEGQAVLRLRSSQRGTSGERRERYVIRQAVRVPTTYDGRHEIAGPSGAVPSGRTASVTWNVTDADAPAAFARMTCLARSTYGMLAAVVIPERSVGSRAPTPPLSAVVERANTLPILRHVTVTSPANIRYRPNGRNTRGTGGAGRPTPAPRVGQLSPSLLFVASCPFSPVRARKYIHNAQVGPTRCREPVLSACP